MKTRILSVLILILFTVTGYAQEATEKTVEAPAAPPLPFHTIEGYGGGAITPMAYLVNPGPKDAIFGAPATAFSYVNLGHKNLQAFTFTETLFQRIELGYGLDRLGLGTLPNDIEDARLLKTDLLGDAIESALSETGGTKGVNLSWKDS
ncbi:MAG: hypothetical protein BWY71_01642 [Planctomycetes bacterium ADurb.Bin412]|nr:MAG: hypothetical protein BWY71_01642 [Planctomycetes bacterium ADurb.Bin412]